MLRRRIGARNGLRWGLFSLAAAVVLVAVSSDPADARTRRKRVHHHRAAQSIVEDARYAAIVVDANTGKVLHAANPDARRHPASLTKIMTLYLLFERLEAGKLKLDSPLQISEHAADQAPTKLGLKAGNTIPVEDVIKGMVTRSANDAAVVVAENLGGDEDDFAEMMTQKARALGMTRTVYKNASGLPDDDQVTTARDQAILGRAIQERFPRYYRYFSTRAFAWRGVSIRNHNRLLGNVEGVDGIKTGYTRASGFNLVTSVKRDGRHIVAVVLGGSSAGSRDARMRDLISTKIAEASTRRAGPVVAQAAEKQDEPKTAAPQGQRYIVASTGSTPARAEPGATAAIAPSHPSLGSTEPIRPVLVKTVTVRSAGNQAAVPARPAPVQTASLLPHLPSVGARTEEPSLPVPVAKADLLPPPPPGARPGVLGVLPAPPSEAMSYAARQQSAPAAEPAAPYKPRSGWIIQVGAYPAEDVAKQQLASVKTKAARLLARADPFTETVAKGDKTYFRARFAGLDKNQAEAACKYLKRNDVDCMTIKN